MSDHVLLNLLNKFGKEIKCEACPAFYLFAEMRLAEHFISFRNEFNKICKNNNHTCFFMH